MPKGLGKSKSADDSATWGKCCEAIQCSEVEIRHVGDKIVIREIEYEKRCIQRSVQHSFSALTVSYPCVKSEMVALGFLEVTATEGVSE